MYKLIFPSGYDGLAHLKPDSFNKPLNTAIFCLQVLPNPGAGGSTRYPIGGIRGHTARDCTRLFSLTPVSHNCFCPGSKATQVFSGKAWDWVRANTVSQPSPVCPVELYTGA